MHYKDGTPAKLGDLIKRETDTKDAAGELIGRATAVGILSFASAGSATCNGRIHLVAKISEGKDLGRVTVQASGEEYVTIGECEKLA